LPREVRESFGKCCAVFERSQPLRGEDAVAASVRKMSNQEADECAAADRRDFRADVPFPSHTSGARTSAVVQLHRDRAAPNSSSPALAATN
jgi:hypothetical protein